MKVVSRYCDSCGIKIPASDIRDGLAFEHEEAFYCKDCKDEVIPLLQRSRRKSRPSRPAGRGSGKAASSTSRNDSQQRRRRSPGGRPAGRASDRRKGTKSKPGRRRRSSGTVQVPSESGIERYPFESEKKSGLPLVAVGAGAGLLIVVIVVAVLVMGNGDDVTTGQEEGAVSATVTGQLALARHTVDHASKEPEDIVGLEARLSVLDLNLLKRSLEGDDLETVRTLEALREKVNTYNLKADQAAEDARLEALRHKGDPEKALDALDGFPSQYHRTRAYYKVLKERRQYQVAGGDADRLAEVYLDAADALAGDDRFDAIGGLLAAFPREFKDSPAYARVRGRIFRYEDDLFRKLAGQKARDRASEEAELQAAQEEIAERAREELLAKLRDIPDSDWVVQLGGDLLAWNIILPQEHHEIFKLEGKDLVVKNDTGQDVLRAVPGPRNQDYVLEYQVRVDRGSYAVAMRIATQVMPQGGFRLAGMGVVEPMHDSGSWQTVRVAVLGNRFYQVVGGELQELASPHAAPPTGGFGFYVQTGTEVRFRNVRLFVMSRQEG